MHSESRINSVKTVRKNFQSKEAAMLEKKACRDSAFTCVGFIRRIFFSSRTTEYARERMCYTKIAK